MSQLKRYWDNINPTESSEIDVETSLDNVLSKINRRRNFYFGGMLAVLPLVLLVAFLTIWNQPQPQMLQCYAAPGEHKTVLLSDGSTVTLNSGSSLVYSSVYGRGLRSVALSGEARFEVAKDKRHPFVVKTKDFDVTVLGTVFNVTSFPDRKTSSVVLESGSVKINRENSETKLVPGEKAELSKDGVLAVSKVNAEDFSNWINGGFVLKSADISELVALIENTYAVSVRCSYSDKYSEACITAKSESHLSLEQFLDLLVELIPGMEYVVDGDTVNLI